MSVNGPKHKRFGWRRFVRDERGSALVEYGLVAAPFFLMIFGIIETMVAFLATGQLEAGLERVARRIRTGEVQAANMTADQFKQILCDEVAPLIACDGNLYVDVREFDNFSDTTHDSPLDEDGNVRQDFQFDTGTAGSVIVARAFYVWDLHLPDVGLGLSNMSGSDRLLTAAAAFRNEPWLAE